MGADSMLFQPPGAMQAPRQPAGQQQAPMQFDVGEEINGLNRRIRVLEERYSNMTKKFQVTDQNMIRHSKDIVAELKTIMSDISELRKNMDEIKSKIVMMIKELQTCAKRDELEVMRRYINLWDPVHFVTQDEVEKLVKEGIEKKEE